jgi:hypothetical protein
MATLTSTPIASAYYQVTIGGDALAVQGIMKAVLALARKARPATATSWTAPSSPSTPKASRPVKAVVEGWSWDEIEAGCGPVARPDRGSGPGLCQAPRRRSSATAWA